MRSVVFVCLAVGLLTRPSLGQSAPSTAPTQALEVGISVTGVGRIANFTSHVLVFSPTSARSDRSSGKQVFWRDSNAVSSEAQAKEIESEVNARQAALISVLEKLKLGTVKVMPNEAASTISFGPSGRSYRLSPDYVYVYPTQRECDGETIGGLSRQKFLEAIQDDMEGFSITLQSSVDSKDEKIWREATAQAIANGRASANAIASAGGVKLGKLAAAREEIERRSTTTRSMTLTPEKAILTSTGGISVQYALRFSIR